MLSGEKVPEALLVVVFTQFGSVMVAWALYLRETQLGKCASQVTLVLGIHFRFVFTLLGVAQRHLCCPVDRPFSLSPGRKTENTRLPGKHLAVPRE